MVVRSAVRNSTYHVVECDDEGLAEVIGAVDLGDEVRLELRRVGRRGNAWCVTEADVIGESREARGSGGDSDGDRRSEADAGERDSGTGDLGTRGGEETDPVVGC